MQIVVLLVGYYLGQTTSAPEINKSAPTEGYHQSGLQRNKRMNCFLYGISRLTQGANSTGLILFIRYMPTCKSQIILKTNPYFSSYPIDRASLAGRQTCVILWNFPK